MPKKDYFAQLSPSQKAELFSIYARGGYKTLSSIKEHYNKYAKGGEIGDPPDSTTPAPGAATLEKYAGTRYDPMYFWEWIADTEDSARRYLVNRDIRESAGAQDVADYFNSYISSPGFSRIRENQRQWWLNRHPYRRIYNMGSKYAMRGTDWLHDTVQKYPFTPNGVFDLSTYPELSTNRSGNGHLFITNGTLNDEEWPYNFVLPHEMMHSANVGGFVTPYDSAQSEALRQNQNTAPGHDSNLIEMHSDKEALMYLLYKEGIYDSRGNKDATPEDIEKLRKKYPKIRPLLQMDNERAAWMINHVVDASGRQNMSNIIADGGQLGDPPSGEIEPVIVTPDRDYTIFLNSLPANQKYTPEEDYATRRYWELNGRPKDFEAAKKLGMYTWDNSDNSYHANSIAWGDDGIGYFMKPKHHDTIKYELDWYNKGLVTEEGGKQHLVSGKEKEEWENFRNDYKLDTSGNFYRYIPKLITPTGNTFDTGGPVGGNPVTRNLNVGNTQFTARDNTVVKPTYNPFINNNAYNTPGIQSRYNLGYTPDTFRTYQHDVRLDDGPMGFIPYVGDALQAGQAFYDFGNGNYGSAALNAGLLFLPNIIEKPGRRIIKQILPDEKLYKLFNRGKDYLSSTFPKFGKWINLPSSKQWKALGEFDIPEIKKSVVDYQQFQDLNRNRFVNTALDYNNVLNSRIRPASRWENFLNNWGLTKSDDGFSEAAAMALASPDESSVVLFNGFDRGTIGHELRHLVQYRHGLHSPGKIKTSYPNATFNGIFDDAQNILNIRNAGKDSWFRDLDEFDAELEYSRQMWYPNTSWKELSPTDQRKINGLNHMRDMFNLKNNEEADYLMRLFYKNGYKCGGKIK